MDQSEQIDAGPLGYRALERAALAYVLESEEWSRFMTWMDEAKQTAAAAQFLRDYRDNPGPLRALWLAHGGHAEAMDLLPIEDIQGAAELLRGGFEP